MEIICDILQKHTSSPDNNHLASHKISMSWKDFWKLEGRVVALLHISKLLSSNKVLAGQKCYSEAGTLMMNERHSLALAGWSPSSPATRATCSSPLLENEESMIKMNKANSSKQLTIFCHLVKVTQIKQGNIHFCKSGFLRSLFSTALLQFGLLLTWLISPLQALSSSAGGNLRDRR